MTNKEMQITLSKAMYWDEVIKRDNGCEILKQELKDEVERLGTSILFILKEYAERNKGKSPI